MVEKDEGEKKEKDEGELKERCRRNVGELKSEKGAGRVKRETCQMMCVF